MHGMNIKLLTNKFNRKPNTSTASLFFLWKGRLLKEKSSIFDHFHFPQLIKSVREVITDSCFSLFCGRLVSRTPNPTSVTQPYKFNQYIPTAANTGDGEYN
jgi:hypothetical protein